MITFRQYLIEAISLTSEKGVVKQIINDAIKRVMKFVHEEINEDNKSGNINSTNLMKKVTEYLTYEVPHALSTVLNKKYNKEPYRIGGVTFEREMNADGDLSSWTIVRINKKYTDIVVNELFGEIEGFSYSNPFFNEDGTFDSSLFKEACTYYETTRTMEIAIDKIVDIFIHELVHLMQIRSQSKRIANVGNVEYRSYLTKDKKEFSRAINQKANDYDMKIYHGSPQEIDAFAHNLAMELLNIATGGLEVEDFTEKHQVQQLEGMLFSIEEMLKEREYRQAEVYKTRYKDFNDSKKRDYYKVYKRFMKKVYSEVQQYIAHIKSKIKELNNTEDWWND